MSLYYICVSRAWFVEVKQISTFIMVFEHKRDRGCNFLNSLQKACRTQNFIAHILTLRCFSIQIKKGKTIPLWQKMQYGYACLISNKEIEEKKIFFNSFCYFRNLSLVNQSVIYYIFTSMKAFISYPSYFTHRWIWGYSISSHENSHM